MGSYSTLTRSVCRSRRRSSRPVFTYRVPGLFGGFGLGNAVPFHDAYKRFSVPNNEWPTRQDSIHFGDARSRARRSLVTSEEQPAHFFNLAVQFWMTAISDGGPEGSINRNRLPSGETS